MPPHPGGNRQNNRGKEEAHAGHAHDDHCAGANRFVLVVGWRRIQGLTIHGLAVSRLAVGALLAIGTLLAVSRLAVGTLLTVSRLSIRDLLAVSCLAVGALLAVSCLTVRTLLTIRDLLTVSRLTIRFLLALGTLLVALPLPFEGHVVVGHLLRKDILGIAHPLLPVTVSHESTAHGIADRCRHCRRTQIPTGNH